MGVVIIRIILSVEILLAEYGLCGSVPNYSEKNGDNMAWNLG